jgi:16S rRNA (uracil1498-N3)-methyltransferase
VSTRLAARAPTATVFARGPFQVGGVVILEDEEAHHVRVRRLGDGAIVRLVDGHGAVATARVAFDRELIAARVIATTTVAPPPATELWVGAGDRERFLLLVEKATELGATRVVPLVTERSQQVATRFQAVHVDKAVRRAREALKQSGGTWIPTVSSPLALSEAIRQAGGTAAGTGAGRFVADAEGGALPALREGDGVQWMVGPEGGFTEGELVAVKGAGFRPIALGRAVLRFDTAGISALAQTAGARIRGAESH